MFSFIIIRVLRWILYEDSFDNIDNLIIDGFTLEKIKEKLNFKKVLYRWKCFIIHPVIIILHFIYSYFILIFGNINSNTQIPLFISMIISLFFHYIACIVLTLIISAFRFLALKKKNEAIFNISIYINNIL